MDERLELLRSVFSEQTLTVPGAQWGDEGKGKIVALLAQLFDLIARYSGASNAGHTAYTHEGRKIVSHQIPCGMAARKTCIIGRGLMFDPVRFAQEYHEAVKVLGVRKMPSVLIDDQCTVWTPWHTLLESWVERCRHHHFRMTLNTTKRGVGPMAALRDLRIDLKVADLVGPKDRLASKVRHLCDQISPILEAEKRMNDVRIPESVDVVRELASFEAVLREKVVDTTHLLRVELKNGRRVLFEGAQATGLDLLAGTYPFVSSGMSTAAGAAYGTGVPPRYIHDVLLVAKFYPTRVGEGPFVSEMWRRQLAEYFPKEHPELFSDGPDREEFLREKLVRINNQSATPSELAQYLQVLQKELGASTGRGRSIGYPDLPILRYAAAVNGAKYIALTCLDAFDGFNEIPIVVDYRRRQDVMPRGMYFPSEELRYCSPIVATLSGWQGTIRGCKNEQDLPVQALDIIKMIESETGAHVLIVGTGPESDSYIVRPPNGIG